MQLILFENVSVAVHALSGATILGESGSGSNGNEGVLRIPQSSNITGTAPSDCLMSYPGHSLWGAYPSAESQSVYSTLPQPTGQYTELMSKQFYFRSQFNISTQFRCQKTTHTHTHTHTYIYIYIYILFSSSSHTD